MGTCRFCGTSNRADATFCGHCGGALKPVAMPSAAGASVYARSAQSAANGGSMHAPINSTGRLPPQAHLAGRYLVLKNVGQGGMAAVYKATNLRSGATVAIKEMSQDGLSPSDLAEALASFRSEAKMLADLRHPNLPRVYESFEDNTRQYLVMEFIDGETLEQRQQRANGAALPQAEVLGWARQLCDVLTYLHNRKPPIIFRDLKPANIMLTPNGQIKLIDFGIARVFAPGRVHDTQVLGTPGFAPPEQYGKAQTDVRADLYALGCTLYQLLTGYDPATTPFNLPPMHSRNAAISPVVQVAIERATKL
ncbi:MAG: protein kinase domain-containing protein, partial [Ktedonobacterales bacterium]